jgi:hypothetical protein
MDPAVIGVAGTLAGTIIGAGLSRLASKGSAKEEREHQASELIRQRREAAAQALDTELERLDEAMPLPATPSAEALPAFQEAGRILRLCEKRAALIEDEQITDRLHALNFGLFVALNDAEELDGKGSVNAWSMGFAFSDLYAAVHAYQLRKDPPPATFLTVDEQRELIGDNPIGMPLINRAMRRRRVDAMKGPPAK